MSKMSACRGAYYFATPKTRQAQSALRKPDDGGVLFSGEALYAGPSAQWSVAHGIPRRPVPMIRTMVGFANLSSRNLSDDVLRTPKIRKRSGASSVYRTVCWMLRWPSQPCSALVSCPAFARA
jgi:hypothetical protein